MWFHMFFNGGDPDKPKKLMSTVGCLIQTDEDSVRSDLTLLCFFSPFGFAKQQYQCETFVRFVIIIYPVFYFYLYLPVS